MQELNQLAPQAVAAATVWAFTQGMAWLNRHLTPEQRDKALRTVAAAASAFAGFCVVLVSVLDDAQQGKVDAVNVQNLLAAALTMAQVFGISQLYHRIRKIVTGWLFS